MTSTLALFTAFSLALAPAPSSSARCAASDLRCLGPAHVEDANAATDPADVARHLAAASSAYIGLFRETADATHLCTAKHLTARGLENGRLRAVLTKYQDEALAELARVGTTCPIARDRGRSTSRQLRVAIRPPIQSEAANPATATPDGKAVAATTLPTDTTPRPLHREVLAEATAPAAARRTEPRDPPRSVDNSAPSAVDILSLTAEPPAQRADPLLPVKPQAVHVRRPAPPARHGLGLLISGSIALGTAAVFAGVSGYAAGRRGELVQARDDIRADTTAKGYTDPAIDAAWPEMEAAAQRWHRTMLGTAITGGLVGALAVGLIVGGAARRHHLAVRPSLGSVLFIARF